MRTNLPWVALKEHFDVNATNYAPFPTIFAFFANTYISVLASNSGRHRLWASTGLHWTS